MTEEEMTAASILSRLLSRVPDTVDKREGSIIYDALAPAAWELSAAYRFLLQAYAESYIETAVGTALDLRVGEMGLTRLSATKAVRKGVFTDTTGAAMTISIGARFTSLDGTLSQNYAVIEEIATGEYKLEAETAGTDANDYIGPLSPITHIEGLGSATLSDVLILGENEETDEELRSRYYDYIRNEVQEGNTSQYAAWASTFPGIGQAKVFPLWDGANTVKVSILDSDNRAASSTLIDDFQAYLDPDSEGLGNGEAPIGAVVTVSTATEIPINVAVNIALTAGYLMADVEDNIEAALIAHFKDVAYQRSSVYLYEVGAVIYNTEGVAAATGLELNSGTADIALGDEEIGALGTLTVGAIT